MSDEIREECDCNEGYGPSVDCGRCHGTGFVERLSKSDEIRKRFEEEFDIPDFLDFDGEDYMYYEEDPLLIEQQQNTSAQWRGFKAGHKSRDEEVKELQEENNSLSVSIRKCGDEIGRLEAENKELKESIANTAQYQKGYGSGLKKGEAENKKQKTDIAKTYKEGKESQQQRIDELYETCVERGSKNKKLMEAIGRIRDAYPGDNQDVREALDYCMDIADEALKDGE